MVGHIPVTKVGHDQRLLALSNTFLKEVCLPSAHEKNHKKEKN
jgi:hypothetical protein